MKTWCPVKGFYFFIFFNVDEVVQTGWMEVLSGERGGESSTKRNAGL